MRDLQTIARACELEQERIQELRFSIWTSGGLVEPVCEGLDLKPLTFQAAIDLFFADNSLLVGGDVDAQQCILYMWRNSVQYRPGRQKALDAVTAACLKLSASRVFTVCKQHVVNAFFDLPVRGGGSSSSCLPPVEPLVAIVEELASRYGIDPATVLNWPIARGYALQRAAYIRTIPEYSPPIPKTLFDLNNLYAEELTRQMGSIGEEGDSAQ